MIHQFKQCGYNIVLDVCSGSIHVVDDIAYDIISLFEEKSEEERQQEEFKVLTEYICMFLKKGNYLFIPDEKDYYKGTYILKSSISEIKTTKDSITINNKQYSLSKYSFVCFSPDYNLLFYIKTEKK